MILSYILKIIWWINVVLAIFIQWDTNIELKLLFHGPAILPYILEDCLMANVITGILDPCDPKINHIKCMWVSDLHFMVQWFCLTSWRLFDEGLLYCRYWFSVTLSLTYNYICRSVTYILWYSDSVIFQYYLMNKPHSLDIGSNMSHWPVFLDLAILNHLPICDCSGLFKCVMKIFVNIARLETGQLLTARDGGIRILWTNF